jgi:hypothetical protein
MTSKTNNKDNTKDTNKDNSKDATKGGPNATTTKAGLAFNVNTVKSSMKSFFETQASEQPMFSGSHIAMTAMIQKLADVLLRESMKYVTKDKTGMKTVTRPCIKQAICINTDLNEYFYQKMLKFNKNGMYGDQIPVSRKEFDAMCTSMDKSLKLTPKAFNFLAYLLYNSYTDILSTAHQFIKYAKKSTLNAAAVMSAVENRFCDNTVHELMTEMKRACAAAGDDVTEKTVDDETKDTHKQQDAGTDSGDEAAQEEAKTKEKGKEKDTKKADDKEKDKPKGKPKKEAAKEEDNKKADDKKADDKDEDTVINDKDKDKPKEKPKQSQPKNNNRTARQSK